MMGMEKCGKAMASGSSTESTQEIAKVEPKSEAEPEIKTFKSFGIRMQEFTRRFVVASEAFDYAYSLSGGEETRNGVIVKSYFSSENERLNIILKAREPGKLWKPFALYREMEQWSLAWRCLLSWLSL